MHQAALGHLQEMVCRYPVLAGSMDRLARAAGLITECHRAGGKLLLCGNGGSAADAGHIAGELMKGFRLPRPLPEREVDRLRAAGYADWQKLARGLQMGLRAIALSEPAALITAIANDMDPVMVFAQQVFVLGEPRDLVLGLSTSGSSANVLCALKVAKAIGLGTIGLCGAAHDAMDGICDCVLHVPETEPFKVQELHLPVYHAICLAVEEELFGAGGGSSQGGGRCDRDRIG